MSSERWRSDRPPMVLLGAMRQWARILLPWTRPYLGTASSMSKTLAVSTYSGGSSSSEWIERRPDLRSRLSSAHLTRISFALASASIRWLRDRSGAIEEVEDVVLVAITMGGESTHQRESIKCKAANSPAPQPEVDLRRDWWMVSPRVCRGFRPYPESPCAIRAAAPGSRKLSVPTATSVAP